MTKYLLYAIGEILLVTIGILIAVKINNLNQNSQKESDLQAIYSSVEIDLVSDTLELNRITSKNEELDSMILAVLLQEAPLVSLDTINENNIIDCDPCFPMHANFNPFTPFTKGYETLRKFDDDSEQKSDSLTFKIIQFYTGRIELLNDVDDIINDMVIDNVRDLEQYPWYVNFTTGDYTLAQAKFFLEDINYRNRLSTYRLLRIANYQALISDYKLKSIKLIKEIQSARVQD